MLDLKEYQREAIDALRDYLRRVQTLDAAGIEDAAGIAFQSETGKRTGEPLRYLDIGQRLSIPELRGLPYVCLRLPTGGGKTLVAAHAAGVAVREATGRDRGVVLWLVPSEAIRSQTLGALRDPRHPYRVALEDGLGPVRVADVGEALYLGRAAYEAESVVVVATAQSFKAVDKDGRRVYRQNGELKSHFETLPAAAALDAGLDVYEGTEKPIPSLANVLRLRRPVVIVDEAHNQRQPLAFDTLARFRPSVILELTATPDRGVQGSNVLFGVSAAALKAEAMIKLPLTLTVTPDWRAVLDMALGQRAALERDAALERERTGQDVRPMLLVQAQPRHKDRETVTVDVVEQYLTGESGLDSATVAVHAYDHRELDGVDLMDPACPVRVVVTVDALREGWDAPFAYVLAALGSVSTGTAVEQLVGRVLRMPFARRKETASLNEAYVFAASDKFADTLKGLHDALVASGFEEDDARAQIRSSSYVPAASGGLPDLFAPAPVSVALDASTARDVLGALAPDVRACVAYDAGAGVLVVPGLLGVAERVALEAAVPEQKRAELSAKLDAADAAAGRRASVGPSASERGEAFEVPVLAVQQGDLFRLTPSDLLDYDWSLNDYTAGLPGYRLPSFARDAARVDIEPGHVTIERVAFLDDVQRQMTLFAQDTGWDETTLVNWLDRALRLDDVAQDERRAFLRRVVGDLIRDRSMPVGALVYARRSLATAVEDLIRHHRAEAGHRGFQLLLDGTAGELTVDAERPFSFQRDAYPYHQLYDGPHRFTRHYYPLIGEMNTEEVAVALALEGQAEVETWVRNVERKRHHSFWLPTATDLFYPDFVARLSGGRILAVEHKSTRDWTNDDTREKRLVGEVWEKRSGGRTAFAMTRDSNLSAITDALGRLVA